MDYFLSVGRRTCYLFITTTNEVYNRRPIDASSLTRQRFRTIKHNGGGSL